MYRFDAIGVAVICWLGMVALSVLRMLLNESTLSVQYNTAARLTTERTLGAGPGAPAILEGIHYVNMASVGERQSSVPAKSTTKAFLSPNGPARSLSHDSVDDED